MAITKAEAIASAEANADGLRRHLLWQAALDGAVASGTALTVRLEANPPESPFYFIVTFAQQSRVTARMAIHADTAAVREAQGIERAGTQLRTFVDPLSVVVPPPIGTSSGVLPVPTGPAPIVEPDLFWRPSRASTSMLQPFFVVHVGARKLFVRVDGTVFDGLDTGGHG